MQKLLDRAHIQVFMISSLVMVVLLINVVLVGAWEAARGSTSIDALEFLLLLQNVNLKVDLSDPLQYLVLQDVIEVLLIVTA